jgi:hypothetical protein
MRYVLFAIHPSSVENAPGSRYTYLMTASPELHTLKISARPPQPWIQTIYAFLFMVVFDFACLMINGSQFIFLLPLRVLPFQWASKLYKEGIRYTKGAFACLLSESLTRVSFLSENNIRMQS